MTSNNCLVNSAMNSFKKRHRHRPNATMAQWSTKCFAMHFKWACFFFHRYEKQWHWALKHFLLHESMLFVTFHKLLTKQHHINSHRFAVASPLAKVSSQEKYISCNFWPSTEHTVRQNTVPPGHRRWLVGTLRHIVTTVVLKEILEMSVRTFAWWLSFNSRPYSELMTRNVVWSHGFPWVNLFPSHPLPKLGETCVSWLMSGFPSWHTLHLSHVTLLFITPEKSGLAW